MKTNHHHNSGLLLPSETAYTLVYGVYISLNKPAFSLLWLPLEFFPVWSQGPLLGSLPQGLTRDLGHDNNYMPKITLNNLDKMGKFLEWHKLSKVTREETEHLNRPKTGKKIELAIKNFAQRKTQAQTVHLWILSNTRRRINTNSSQSLPKRTRGRNTSQLILWSQYNLNSKTRQRLHKKNTDQHPWIKI